jgi:membrane protease YdiL (CAAX protease family)
MGRTVGQGSRLLRDMARRRTARRLARTSASAAAALVDETIRLRLEVEALAARLVPALEDARHAVSDAEEWLRPAAGERLGPAIQAAREEASRRTGATAERLGPALHDARDETRRRVIEAGRRLDPLLADASRLAERATRLAERAGRGRGAAGVVARGPADETPGLAPVAVGLAAAQACFAATFRGPRDRFWDRMTLTGLALGGYALLARPALRSTRIRPAHVALGAASAAVLYGTFAVGDRVARRIVPSGSQDIAEIYALRELRPRGEIALRLVTIIGPAEELFWRGLVQGGLMTRYGRWRGAALAAAAYGGVHVVTGNFTLFGAAGIAGAHWCALYAAGVPLGALVVSHQLWDVWIFLVQPTGDVGAPVNP